MRAVQTLCALLLVAAVLASSHEQDAILIDRTVAAYKSAAEDMARTYKYDPLHVCASATIHGSVRKECGPECLPMADTYKVAHEHKVPIYSGAKGTPVHISQRYHFIYIRQPKSASSSILANIKDMLCGKAQCDEAVWTTLPVEEVRQATWAEFFVFTMVRNPWTRMASSYTFLTGRFLFKRRAEQLAAPGSPCRIGFAPFTRDSHALMEMCETKSCCAYIQRIAKWLPEFVEGHTSDQAHSVFSADGKSLVDFIARSEHASEDWAEIVRIINEREGTEFTAAGVQMKNRQKANDKEAGFRCNETTYAAMYDAVTMRNVAVQYAREVILFGFLEGIPPEMRLQ